MFILKLYLFLSNYYLQLHWHLDKFYDSRSAYVAALPPSVGHFFEEQMAAFVAGTGAEPQR